MNRICSISNTFLVFSRISLEILARNLKIELQIYYSSGEMNSITIEGNLCEQLQQIVVSNTKTISAAAADKKQKQKAAERKPQLRQM